MFDLQYGVSLADFVSNIDPIQQFKTLNALNSPNMLQECGLMPSLQCCVTKPFFGIAFLKQSFLTKQPESNLEFMEDSYNKSGCSHQSNDLPTS
jgi:hypothetical protein